MSHAYRHSQGHVRGVYRPDLLPTGTEGTSGPGPGDYILDNQFLGTDLILEDQLGE